MAGLSVTAIPRGRDILWSASATTGPDGSFSMALYAPAEYLFFLSRGGLTVITPETDDPARLLVSVSPGERRTGVELHFLEEQWRGVEGSRQ